MGGEQSVHIGKNHPDSTRKMAGCTEVIFISQEAGLNQEDNR